MFLNAKNTVLGVPQSYIGTYGGVWDLGVVQGFGWVPDTRKSNTDNFCSFGYRMGTHFGTVSMMGLCSDSRVKPGTENRTSCDEGAERFQFPASSR